MVAGSARARRSGRGREWGNAVNQADIFGPLGALVALTFLVLLNVPIRRFASAFRGQTKRDDYKLGESDRVPGWVAVANRNLMNLFELPVLFYVLCLSLYVTDLVNERQILAGVGLCRAARCSQSGAPDFQQRAGAAERVRGVEHRPHHHVVAVLCRPAARGLTCQAA